MLILDTNVISEFMRPTPDADVARWLGAQPLDRLAITAVTVAEILYGLDVMPDGRRKADLLDRFAVMLRRAFASTVIPFEDAAAVAYAGIRGDRERAGRPISVNDAMIAAIARAHGATIATRNVADFQNCGIAVFNPWTAAPFPASP